MVYLRSFIFSIYMISSIIIFSSIILLICYIPYKKRTFLSRFWAISNIYILDKICHLKVKITGMENIPENPCIVFSKHQSTLETIVLQIILTPQVWVLKKELLWIPLFGWTLATGKPVAIDRSSGKKAITQIIEQGIHRLKNKYWLIIFPEGTRSKPGEKVRYKSGGAILAEKSGFDILPISHNSGIFWAKGSFLKKPGSVKFVIGPVIKNNSQSAKQLLSSAEEWIETTYMTL